MEKISIFIEQDAKWQVLSSYILRIKSYSNTDHGVVIENCKSLIESIFKTIICEVKGKTPDNMNNENIGNLNKQVREILQFEEKGYTQIIGSFSNSISQFRNKLGETSHGKDIYTLEENRNILRHDEINFFIELTDNIAFFLLSYYKNLYPVLAEKKKTPVYEDNNEFNDWFNQNEPIVSIVGIELLPSQVLFDNDEEVYKTHLLDYQAKNNLIEELKISPSFAYTHDTVSKLSQEQSFSDSQIKRIYTAFMQNNQVNWIATDDDIEQFFKPIIFDNRELFTEEQFKQFDSFYNQ